jgi:uroporphyrin-III C-methyltransferase
MSRRARVVSGFVHLVGAGPGDPELITVRGARALARADAIVHDRLIHPSLLDLARPDALRFDVGKSGHGPSVPQASTTELIVRLARSGLRVVRLKSGDPFVFGRGGEEMLALQAAGIAFEIVPGVTAGVAGPGMAGIPVTHRGLARSVAFVTAATESGPLSAADWAAVSGVDTLVVFMAGHAAPATGQALIDAGRSTATPVAVILDATLESQEVRSLDLRTLSQQGTGERGGRPALLVIGEVAALAFAALGVPDSTTAPAEVSTSDSPAAVAA